MSKFYVANELVEYHFQLNVWNNYNVIALCKKLELDSNTISFTNGEFILNDLLHLCLLTK